MSNKWMIYGANGYTGRLIVELAVKTGMTPVLAGRSVQELQELAVTFDLEYRVFSLDNAQDVFSALRDIRVVLNCAGPFIVTAEKMIQICRQTGTHYIDITGEAGVFEAAHAGHEKNKQAGIVVCPGSGFDVVPTDCIAASLKQVFPEAVRLSLGFQTKMVPSRGTLLTMFKDLGKGALVRRKGVLTRSPFGKIQQTVNFGKGSCNAVAIPWGDVVTAFYSTSIPNITVYLPLSKGKIKLIGALEKINGFLRNAGIHQLVEGYVKRYASGPTLQAREENPAYVWGEAQDAKGNLVIARLKTPNPYNLTLCSALMTVRFLLKYQGKGGYFTPSQLMGNRCVESLPDVQPMVFKKIEPHLLGRKSHAPQG